MSWFDVECPSSQVVGVFGLPESAIARLSTVLSQCLPVQQAVIYGSRAKGNDRPGSDIDLTLIAPNIKQADMLALELAIDDLLLPYQVDLSLLAHIDNPALREHIARAGKIFWQRNESPPSC